MNHKTAEHNSCASDSTRFFFCTQISSAASAADEFVHNKKERSPTWAKEVPIHGRGSVPAARKPTRNRTNAKINPSAKTAQYRNQISTLLGVPPLKFQNSLIHNLNQHLVYHNGFHDLSVRSSEYPSSFKRSSSSLSS